jgi:hypothetical protein
MNIAVLSLALDAKRKQKYQNGNIHRKLTVPTSEREDKLSNPRASAARVACIFFALAKYTVLNLVWKKTE